MSFKNILLHLNVADQADRLLQVGVNLIDQTEGHLVGLYVMSSPVVPTSPTMVIGEQVLTAHRKTMLEREDAVRQNFEAVARNQAFTSEWRVADSTGLVDAVVVTDQARTADLVVMSQHDPESSGPTSAVVERAVLESGRPGIVVPSAGGLDALGNRILIAWNGTRESARATFDALPLLRGAEVVHILTVQSKEQQQDVVAVPGADLAAALARHGVTCETVRVGKGDLRVGDVLLNYAADHSIDLIVMGCYGHTRIQEAIFGGTSRQLLEQATVPLFLSH